MKNPQVIPGVLLFFRRRAMGMNVYALHLRKSGFNAGMYCAPGGHTEGFETYEECAIREAREEIGAKLEKGDLQPSHFLYRKGTEAGFPRRYAIRPDMCFVIEKRKGEFRNMEPEKHGDTEWYTASGIPENTVDYVIQALRHIEKGVFYSTHGF